MISNRQKALIHVAKNELGFDDQTYRDILKRLCGVRSCVDLSQEGFEHVMRHFERCGFATQTSPRQESHYEKWSRLGGRPGMATAAQLAKIEHLWDDLPHFWNLDGNGHRDKALRGFVKRFHCEDLRFLRFETAFAVIEALKGIKARKGV